LPRHQFVGKTQFSARELCLGCIDLGAKVFERLVGRRGGERVEPNGLAYDLHHGRLGSVGDHFDGVDEVLALRAQAIEAPVHGEIFIRNVALRGLVLTLELIDFFL
jgi:hypothetical protein